MPTAVVISNLPIVIATARRMLSRDYSIVPLTWSTWDDRPPVEVDLVVADITSVVREVALSLLKCVGGSGSFVVCSLEHNEVEVYRIEAGAFALAGALPSLLALSAR